MVDWGRIGLGVATGGLSELGGARPLIDKAAGNGYLKNLVFGGDATKSIDANLQNYDTATAGLGQLAANAGNRQAPTVTAAQLDPTQMGQSRAGLYGVANNLAGIASGQQMGAGELAVNRGIGQATAAQTAAARAANGANSALAFRNAMRNTADIGLAGAGQAAQSRMQDQQAANQQLGQIYGNLYGQDANVAQANAGLTQQAGLANQQANLQQQQQNTSAQIQAYGQMLGWDQARINAELQRAGIQMQDKGILPGLLQGAGQAAAAYATGGLSAAPGMMGGGGGGGMPAPGQLGGMFPHGDYGGGPVTSPSQVMSDVRNKTAIAPGSADASRALASLATQAPPYTFAYSNPAAYGQGRQLGTMAQDLERAGLGHVVVDTPKGKAIDAGKLATTNTAMLSQLARDVEQLKRGGGAVPPLPSDPRSGGYGAPPALVPAQWSAAMPSVPALRQSQLTPEQAARAMAAIPIDRPPPPIDYRPSYFDFGRADQGGQ